MNEQLAQNVASTIVSDSHVWPFFFVMFGIAAFYLLLAYLRARKATGRWYNSRAFGWGMLAVIFAGIGAYCTVSSLLSASASARDLVDAASRNELALCPAICGVTEKGVWRVVKVAEFDVNTFVIVPHDRSQSHRARLAIAPETATRIIEILNKKGLKVLTANDVFQPASDGPKKETEPGKPDANSDAPAPLTPFA